MIPKKQSATEKDWQNAIQNIEEIVSKAYIDDLIEQTVKDIEHKTNNAKSAFSWSGGKDSMVLEYVCQLAGLKESVFVHCDLEYTDFMQWVYENRPKGCNMINTKQDIKWLSKHQEMLFPQDSKTAAKWFKIVQHKGQEIYFNENNLDILILGRRKADGNYVGKGNNIYTNNKGITRYSPLAEWKHEDILACIHYYNIELPPIYNWKNGYLCGTHNFAARQYTGSIENGWREVYDIEPEWVYKSAQYIQSAEDFIRKVKE